MCEFSDFRTGHRFEGSEKEKMEMRRAGIDIGTMFVKAVVLNDDDRIVKEYCAGHNGDREMIGNPRFIDPVAATRTAIAQLAPSASNVIDVGFANVTLVELGEHGRLNRISSNSLCAAGTGSFLDEQMVRRVALMRERSEFISEHGGTIK